MGGFALCSWPIKSGRMARTSGSLLGVEFRGASMSRNCDAEISGGTLGRRVGPKQPTAITLTRAANASEQANLLGISSALRLRRMGSISHLRWTQWHSATIALA